MKKVYGTITVTIMVPADWIAGGEPDVFVPTFARIAGEVEREVRHAVKMVSGDIEAKVSW